MSTLYGWSLESFYGIDHTYVTSSDGHVWNCWGRSSGGQVICSGTADAGHADCLSQKNSRAGLLYGLTGVCHQTANRILYPARCIVSKAKNYWLSSFLYGTYGLSVLKFQTRLANCLPEQDYHRPREDYEVAELSEESAYLRNILRLHANAAAKLQRSGTSKERTVFQLLQNELKLTAAYRLGSTADKSVKNLLEYQKDLLIEKNFYDRALMARRLAPDKYADKINEIANSAFKDLQKSLGEQQYRKMFGIMPEVQLLDPAIVYQFYHRTRG